VQHAFVDGAPTDLDGDEIDITDPATGAVVETVVESGPDGVDHAVHAAQRAAGEWAATPASARGKVLAAVADAITAQADALAPLLTAEQGKPLRESRLELHRCAETLRHYAGLALNIRGAAVAGLDPATRGMVLNRPLGVVGAIVPWNFPTTLLANKLGPALVTGNAIVAKPDETTPLVTLRLAAIAHEAGLPAGVFNVVTGTGERTGDALVRHPGVRKIAFTGSTPVGKRIMAGAADDLKRVTLELGGSDPMIICADADVDRAISAASMGRFFNCGQACLAIKRVYAERSIVERVAEGLGRKAAKLVVGRGDATGTQIGPMHSGEGRELIAGQLSDGVASGGDVLAGGGVPDGAEWSSSRRTTRGWRRRRRSARCCPCGASPTSTRRSHARTRRRSGSAPRCGPPTCRPPWPPPSASTPATPGSMPRPRSMTSCRSAGSSRAAMARSTASRRCRTTPSRSRW
jgi:acyl-CoA reductase-like NAD-dependent aldehyde dehydrogenase